MNIMKELRNRALRNKFEIAENGLFFPGSQLLIGGVFDFSVNNDTPVIVPNRMVDQGLEHILSVIFSSGTKVATWYIAPFANNVTPAASWTTTNFTATAGEFTNYTEATRQTWVAGAVTALSIGNASNRAFFTVGVGAQATIWGAALISSSAKSATSGTLAAAAKMVNSRDNLQEGDSIGIGYTVSISDNS